MSTMNDEPCDLHDQDEDEDDDDLTGSLHDDEYDQDEDEDGRKKRLARWGANPHIENKWYDEDEDEDDDDEGPNAWPFIAKRPTLYEAFMKGRNAWLQADDDSLRLLREARESVALAVVADATRAMLDTFRSPGRA